MKKLFLFLILSQILVIIYLSLQIYHKQKNVLGEKTINLIKKEEINFVLSSNLKYFYEPKSNFVQEIKKDWLPYYPTYTFNNDFLNERFNYPIKKPNKTYRIITLGDSFTFGQNVSTERNWVELLEDKLNKEFSCQNINKFEVINLGVYGYDIQYAVERYRLRGTKYNPDLVIWTFTDYERILEKMMPDIKEHESEAEKLENQSIYYQNWSKARENLKEEIGTKGFDDYLKEQFEKFKNLYQGELLLITFPQYDIYINHLKKFSKDRPKTYFFQEPIKWENKQYFLPDNHLNDFGHQKIAEEVFNYLVKEKIFPCNL